MMGRERGKDDGERGAKEGGRSVRGEEIGRSRERGERGGVRLREKAMW